MGRVEGVEQRASTLRRLAVSVAVRDRVGD